MAGMWCFLLIPVFTAVTLVEKSEGLDDPELENGRTEYELLDMDGDGHLDLVSVGDHGSPGSHQHGITLWFGDGQGHWESVQEGNFGYGGVALGDLNNDGLMDAAWGIHHNYGSGGFGDQLIGAALGNGTGTGWIPWGNGLGSGGETWGMFATDLADFDNDGLLDLVSQSFGAGNGVRVYRNHGDGTWSQEWSAPGANTYYTLQTGDFDADGNMDFICTRDYENIWFGDGSFGFTLTQAGLPQKLMAAVDAGDLNNDGRDDILVSMGSDSGVRAYCYDPAAGEWEDFSAGLPSGVSYTMVQFGLLNGDAFLDAAVYAGTQGRIYLGNGQGVWTGDAVFNFSTPGHFSAMRILGDFDHDGREDIVVQAAEGSTWDYTNILRAFSPWQEPQDLSLSVVTPIGGEHLWAGSVRTVRWLAGVPASMGQGSVDIHLSVSGPGGPWETVTEGAPDNGAFQWAAPQKNSSQCRIRITLSAGGQSVQAVSPGDFTIQQGTGIESPSSPLPVPSSGVVVFPNPCIGQPEIRVSEGPGEIRVFDMSGRLAARIPVPEGGPFQTVLRGPGGEPLPTGVYPVIFEGPSGTSETMFLQLR